MLRTVVLVGLSAVATLIAGCDSNRVPVDGTVFSAEYKCRYDIHGDDAREMAARARAGDMPSEAETFGDCSHDADFLKARADFDGNETRLSGHAKFRVSYVSPIDNTSQEGELDFDGDDREFYTLHRNSPVKLMVDQIDHSNIRFGG